MNRNKNRHILLLIIPIWTPTIESIFISIKSQCHNHVKSYEMQCIIFCCVVAVRFAIESIFNDSHFACVRAVCNTVHCAIVEISFFFLLKCQKRFSLCSAKQNFSLQSGMYAKCAMCAQVKNRKKKRTGKCMPKFLHLCLSFYDSFQYACNQQCLWRGQTHKSKHKWNWLKSSRDVLNSIYIEYMNKIDKRARKSHVLLVKTICIWFR